MTDGLELAGGVPLRGTVAVRGAKNSVPKTMVAALLTPDECHVDNVAAIADIDIVSELVEVLGGKVLHDPVEGRIAIQAGTLSLPSASEPLAALHALSRIPVLTCAPLLHRTGKAVIYDPGGCSIGTRPVDMHLQVLGEFGADISHHGDSYSLRAERLRGARVSLDYPSVGATEQFLLAAVHAEGDSELRNAAVEPEICDLAAVLQQMGGLVTIAPDRTIRVSGVQELTGFSHWSIPDRLEAASWACTALATGGEITVTGARQADMVTFLNVFRRAGGGFDANRDSITFRRRSQMPRPLALETDVHPGFMTDWQPPLVTALTQAHGVSIVHETVYEDRFGYTAALNQLGANIHTLRECLGPTPCRFGHRNHIHSAVVVGPSRLVGAEMTVPDLRAGFAYVLAALAAEGWSQLHNISLIRRGYECFVEKLDALGVRMR